MENLLESATTMVLKTLKKKFLAYFLLDVVSDEFERKGVSANMRRFLNVIRACTTQRRRPISHLEDVSIIGAAQSCETEILTIWLLLPDCSEVTHHF